MTLQYLRLGAETPFVQSVQSEKYPYSVEFNPHAAATLKDAEILLTSAQMETLEKRVHLDPKPYNAATVDRFFRVRYKDESSQDLAITTWSHLSWSCKKIQYVSGTLAIGLTLLALIGPPFYIVVAAYVGAVASTCLFGWSLHRYHIAEKQLAVWRSPGEDFAQKRKDALELPLPQILKKKCYFHPTQPTGTLLGVEILSIFRREFKQFATPLLAKTCNTPEEQHRWVLAFFQNNPFGIKFFEDNPQLANEAGWKEVQKFEEQIDLMLKVMKHIEEAYVQDASKRLGAVKLKYETIQKAFVEKTRAYSEANRIPLLNANNYFQRVSKVLNTECLEPIHALYLRDKAKADFFGSLVYSQVRTLLEEANKGLLLDQAYTLDPTIFADPAKFVPGNFQQELDAMTANFPQNVIDKAKALAPQEPYQNFVTAAFQA